MNYKSFKAIFLCLYISPLVSFASSTPVNDFSFMQVGHQAPFLADDGSIIRNLPSLGNVQTVQCTLRPNEVIQACVHKTVSQIWYVISGEGEVWLKDKLGIETVNKINSGTSFTVPLGFSFQFRNTGSVNLEIFIVNASPWSGPG